MSRSVFILDLVVATFSELGMSAADGVCQTLLVEGGCFIGHKFHCDGGYALWGVGWNAVEFYDGDGKLLKMVTAKQSLHNPAA